MKKYAVVLIVVVLFIFASRISVFGTDIIWDDIGRGNLNLRSVLVIPDNPRVIYIGSSNAVLKTEDAGKTYRSILSVKGREKGINFLSFGPQGNTFLYAATGNGLFYSPDEGRSWRRIFKGKDYWENISTVVAVMPGCIYLGTKKGLFISRDAGRSWHKQTGKLAASGIMAIACDKSRPDYIYVSCVDGVFKTENAGQSWERIFSAHPTENGQEPQEILDDRDEAERFSGIRYIVMDRVNRDYLYLATSKGVYQSKDSGLTWQLLSDYGLLDRDVKFLLILPDLTLCAATKAGIFRYEQERWVELSLGLVAQDIRALDFDGQGNLYVASDKGLFKASVRFYDSGAKTSELSFYYKNEPAINEVQAAAIKYAEVTPEKILAWREQARKKGFLPKVSIGVDRDTSELWHWESGSTTKTGDDILVRGKEVVGWDVSLTWDLGEVIWNDAQTSIDVRSRLMVQLRGDILDEVTKLYFERLRVKMESDGLSIIDTKKRAEKELRLQELTAMLDGLTGGYFSKALNRNKTSS